MNSRGYEVPRYLRQNKTQPSQISIYCKGIVCAYSHRIEISSDSCSPQLSIAKVQVSCHTLNRKKHALNHRSNITFRLSCFLSDKRASKSKVSAPNGGHSPKFFGSGGNTLFVSSTGMISWGPISFISEPDGLAMSSLVNFVKPESSLRGSS